MLLKEFEVSFPFMRYWKRLILTGSEIQYRWDLNPENPVKQIDCLGECSLMPVKKESTI
jgi:hypothetical protein